jgi:hypothetical protein
MTAGAAFMTLTQLIRVAWKAMSNNTFPKVTGVHSRLMQYLIPLRKAKGEKLILLGIICTVLALGTLVVSVQTVSLMKQFREESKERQDCLVTYMLKCGYGDTCESELDNPCKKHSDCIDKAEYCNTEGKCKRCYSCAFDNDGVGGVCPTSSCEASVRMDPSVFCEFSNCAHIIAKLASNPDTINSVSVLLSEDGCLNGSCSDLEAELTACVSVKRDHAPFSKAQMLSCSEVPKTCEDPFLQFEGCQCTTNEFGGYENGGCRSTNHPVCYPVNPDKCLAAVKKWNSEHEEAEHLQAMTQAILTAEYRGIDFDILYERSGCCYDTSPYYTLSETCPAPKKIS